MIDLTVEVGPAVDEQVPTLVLMPISMQAADLE